MALSYVFDSKKSSPQEKDFSFLAASLVSRLVNPVWTFVVSEADGEKMKHAESKAKQGGMMSKELSLVKLTATPLDDAAPESTTTSGAAEAPSYLKRFRSRDIVKGCPAFCCCLLVLHFFAMPFILSI
jgi:hypothetical protein